MSFSVESPGGRGAPLQASILRSPAPLQIGRGSWVRSLCNTLAAFEELVRAGKVLSWGVSNFDERELAAAVAIAGEGRVACDQTMRQLAWPRFSRYCW
jgi:diketogulonate reductase-like aldo/keto reductase